MKTIKPSCILAFIAIAFLNSCQDCTTCEEKNQSLEQNLKTAEKELSIINNALSEEFQFSENFSESYDFCTDNEAALPNRSHNTVTGIANFSIAIPDGSHLKLIKKNKNALFYECDGDVKNDKLRIIPQTITNLTQKKGDSVMIEVVYKNFHKKCENQPDLSQEKKKTSVILGEPFHDN